MKKRSVATRDTSIDINDQLREVCWKQQIPNPEFFTNASAPDKITTGMAEYDDGWDDERVRKTVAEKLGIEISLHSVSDLRLKRFGRIHKIKTPLPIDAFADIGRRVAALETRPSQAMEFERRIAVLENITDELGLAYGETKKRTAQAIEFENRIAKLEKNSHPASDFARLIGRIEALEQWSKHIRSYCSDLHSRFARFIDAAMTGKLNQFGAALKMSSVAPLQPEPQNYNSESPNIGKS